MMDVLRKFTSVTWPWAVAATILVAGFMYWLNAESAATRAGRLVADTAVALPVVSDTAFVIDPTLYSRNRILLTPVTVRELIGRAALTADVATLVGYPLVLERSVMESGMSVVGGDKLSIAGQVYALNDSLLDVYMQRGFFLPENRVKLEGHSTFFLVDSLDFVFPVETGTTQPPGGS